MSAGQVDIVQSRSFPSLTRSACVHAYNDKGILSKVFRAASVPFCLLADVFYVPACLFGRLVTRSPEVAVTEEGYEQSFSADVRKMAEHCVKTTSVVQRLKFQNSDRAKYNDSISKDIEALSCFAAKHTATDTVDVLEALKSELELKFGQDTVNVNGTDCPTVAVQLHGIRCSENLWKVRGFLTEAKQVVLTKAIAELQENLLSDPTADSALSTFHEILEKLKKLEMVTSEEIKQIMSGNEGREVAAAFSMASQRILTVASPKDLSVIKKSLMSHSSLLRTAYGMPSIDMRKVSSEAGEARKAIQVARDADTAQVQQTVTENREHLEQQAAKLEERLALEQKVSTAQEKVKKLVLQLKALQKNPTDKMAALIKKIQAEPNASVVRLTELYQELEALQTEITQRIGQVKRREKQSQATKNEIKKLESQLFKARGELKQAVDALNAFKKANAWMPCPGLSLRRVHAQLEQFGEGTPVVLGRSKWVVPATIAATAAVVGTVAAAVIWRNPTVFEGVELGTTLVKAGSSVWGYSTAHFRKGWGAAMIPVHAAQEFVVRKYLSAFPLF